MLNPDFRDMLSALSDEGAETGDLDLWIRVSALARFGAPLNDVREADLTTAGTVVQIGVAPRRIDFLTMLDGLEFEEAWARRSRSEHEGRRPPARSG